MKIRSIAILIVGLIGNPLMHAMDMSLLSGAWDIVQNYNPLSACTNRAIFARCIAQAIWRSSRSQQTAFTWDWETIQTHEPKELAHKLADALRCNGKQPAEFLFGAGTAAHQVDGMCTADICSWSRWEQQQLGKLVESAAGNACDHWHKYKKDIQLMKQIGMQAYRFSIEWALIEPREGEFDDRALQHYADVCVELVKQGIKPIVGFHHYTDPIWFLDKGGFEQEANIAYYVRYCSKVFEALQHHAHMFITFNSPSGYAMKGYLNGIVPPGKKDMQAAVEVLKNMLESHVQTYQALKRINQNSQIGILKNIYQLDPYVPGSLRSHLGCTIGSMLTNDCMFNFFANGQYNVYVPTKVYVNHYNPQAPFSTDFIGLNYYSNGYMHDFAPVAETDPNKQTLHANYRLYPEGLYRAIQEVSERLAQPMSQVQRRAIPIYVTENGTAPLDDDNDRRTQFYKQYLYALLKAIEDGYDVRGYMTWSFMDNYEWGTLGKKNYGLHRVDFENADLPRTLKPGAQYYCDVMQAYLTEH